MGTNYYLRPRTQRSPCECCGRPFDVIEKHIGKLSLGWEFLFRGYNDIRSFEDWRKYLLVETEEEDSAIYDEYGRELSRNEFLNLARDSKGPGSRSHHDYLVGNHPVDPESDWRDADGWSFNARDFC